MALLNRPVRRGKIPYQRICLVDKNESTKIFKENYFQLQTTGLPVYDYETNNNSPPNGNTVYVLSDFEQHDMFDLLDNTPSSCVLGTTALIELCDDNSKKMRSNPMFSTSMYGLVFYINCPHNIPLMERMVKLIKWMGGLFTSEPRGCTTHMITNSVMARGYDYCYTFGVPVMDPEWVEVCWRKRHKVGFLANSIMENYRIKALTGIGLYFEGFSEDFLIAIHIIAQNNGGKLCHFEDPACTHMVFSDDIASDVRLEDIPLHVRYVVRSEWFWSSVDQRSRTTEEYYTCLSFSSIAETKWARENIKKDSEEKIVPAVTVTPVPERVDLTHSPGIRTSIKLINEDIDLSQGEKRKRIYRELCDTERNYINRLESLVEIHKRATSDLNLCGAVLQPLEAKLIFGNIYNILYLHYKIIGCLESTLANWDTDVLKGQAYTNYKREMMKEYVTFAKNWTESDNTFKKCEKENILFQNLLKSISQKPRSEGFKDLFIRPIQRLPSTSLLLKEIRKHTMEGSPDIESLDEAIVTVDNVLKMMNDDRAKIQKQQEMFAIYNLIADCPPDLIASRRELVAQFSVQEITKKFNSLGVHFEFFLFNDILEVAKVKSKCMFLKNGESASKLEKKPYRHIAIIPLSVITHVLSFEKDTDGGGSIFGFNIIDRINGRKTVHCFLYKDNDLEYEDAINRIAQQIKECHDCGSTISRELDTFILKKLPTERFSIDSIGLHRTKTKTNSSREKDVKNFLGTVKTVVNKTQTRRRSNSCSNLEGTVVQL